ncbi:MAG: polyphosphate polymerase domain-containing protein [Lacrimispora saccharolytica]
MTMAAATMMMMAATTMTMMTTEMTDGKRYMKLRHEQKHQISRMEDLVLAGRLSKLFERDSHAGPDGSYRVTSLYFDTPYDKALREKMDGISRREKFRLRYYGTDVSYIRLEKKFKIGGMCGKRSRRISRDQAQALLAGELALPPADEPLLLELYSKIQGQQLRPKTVVRYDREAFLFEPGNVRITLDRRIRTGQNPQDFFREDFFREDSCLIQVMDPFTVLEVKYDEMFPEIVEMAVQVPGRQASACSKYALCRRFD